MSLRSLRALCLTSFFIADVRDGLGPFLGIFLTQRHWQAEDIGLLMTVGGVAGLLATLPAGFITDTSRHKRVLLAGVCLAITLSGSVRRPAWWLFHRLPAGSARPLSDR